MKASLRTRLTLGFALILVIAIASFALIGRTTISQRFNRMMVQSGREYAGRVAQIFGWYYITNGNWNGVDEIWIGFPQFPPDSGVTAQGIAAGVTGGAETVGQGSAQVVAEPAEPRISLKAEANGGESLMFSRNINPPRDERLLLVDAAGEVIYDSNPDSGSTDTMLANLDEGVQIVVDDEVVGTVIAASSVGILNTFQEAFLSNVNMFVLWGGIGASLLAIALGAWQSMVILKPVKALSEASHKLAQGDYSQRIPVTTEDELGEMTKSFNYMASELENLESLRRRSLADVAHELRTPLSVLQIDLESIEDGIIEPDTDTIQRLQMEVGTLSKLVEDLRILSLADAGELSLDFQPVDVNGLLRINVHRMTRQARDKEITISEDFAPEDLPVWGDEQRLSQVFLNLLSNALQYTPAGGSIHVCSQRTGGSVRVSIQDTGVGIAAQDIPHIFERLYRADSARARRNGGSGLGLSIARSLVLAHHGRIWAESVEGQGSTFFIEIPLFQDPLD